MDGVEVNFSGNVFEFEGITANNVDRIELVRALRARCTVRLR